VTTPAAGVVVGGNGTENPQVQLHTTSSVLWRVAVQPKHRLLLHFSTYTPWNNA
jgi:hypothetical protein